MTLRKLALVCFGILVVVSVLSVNTASAIPTTIIDTGLSTTGQLGISDTQFLSMSFDLAQNYENVSIGLYLDGSAQANVTTWLTTEIGTSSSQADLIANQTIQSINSPSFTLIPVFTGLTLNAGTYFLTLSSTTTNADNPHFAVHCSDPPRCFGAVPLPSGLSYLLIAGPGAPSMLNTSMPYASDFLLSSEQPLTFASIRILADETPFPVPEAATVLLFSSGLVGMMLWRSSRKERRRLR